VQFSPKLPNFSSCLTALESDLSKFSGEPPHSGPAVFASYRNSPTNTEVQKRKIVKNAVSSKRKFEVELIVVKGSRFFICEYTVARPLSFDFCCSTFRKENISDLKKKFIC
jgi:hypothetical protein